MAGENWRQLRILVLLTLLLVVAVGSWLARTETRDWDYPLRVVLYPIDADQRPATTEYIRALGEDDFQPIEDFLSREADRYGVELRQPAVVYLGPQVTELPPEPPRNGNIPAVMAWSLKLRYWAWRVDRWDGPDAQIRIFVIYHDPQLQQRVPHSLGLEKGLIGVVHAFASPAQHSQNQVIIAHELLHTLGATDKYDPTSNLPYYPIGFAEPERRFPQRYAEIMGGRIAISTRQAVMPESLQQVRVGPVTALEIQWID